MIRSPYLLLVFLSIALLGCSTSKKIKDGATAYQQKQYAVAIDKLTEEIKGLEGGEEYARLAYLLGDSYKRLNDSPNSLNWFIEAAKNDYGADAYWEMAYALKKQERYADAVLSFRRLAKLTDRQDLIREEIQKCRKAQEWSQLAAGETYILEPIALNSDASDYAPTLRGDQLVFSSDRYLDSNDDTYNWTGNAFSDLYVSDIDVYGAIPMKGPNTRHNEGTATFTQEGDIMYFTRCYSEVGDEYCQIYRSELRGGAWSLGDPAFQMKPRVNYSEPVLIENDSVLIFISDDPTGVGGSDLYYSFMLDDGTWDIPELMPAYLNSIGDERFPTWDGESLYYSSDQFPGLGGLDIFRTTLNEDGSWTQPQNLLPPFNSSEDDFGYTVVPQLLLREGTKSKVFFTSTRGAFGNDDIYEAVQYFTEEELNQTTTPSDTIIELVEEVSKAFFLKIKIIEPLYVIADDPNSMQVGTKVVPDVSLKISSRDSSEILMTDDNGVVIIPIDSIVELDMVAGKQGYLNAKSAFTLSKEEFDTAIDRYVFETELEIARIYEGVEITLNDIYYDFNEDYIREDAQPSLNKLIEILDNNPGVQIQLSSHTDCRGEADYNQNLSQRRAASAVAYIRDVGRIAPDRLSAIGYGMTSPEIDCVCAECSEDEHQINRRTTFTIIQ